MLYNEAMALVTVATFDTPVEAHLFASALHDAEIENFIFDEHIISSTWLFSYAVGGVKVKIMEEDMAEANRILDHFLDCSPSFMGVGHLEASPQY